MWQSMEKVSLFKQNKFISSYNGRNVSLTRNKNVEITFIVWQQNICHRKQPNDWITIIESPCCKECKEQLVLVVQLYCPLEGSVYHRTLYLFTCVKCQGKSWTLIRQQKIDDSRKVKENKAPPVLESDDWGMDADDWGTDANDWGCDENDIRNEADSGHNDINVMEQDVNKVKESVLNSYANVVKRSAEECSDLKCEDVQSSDKALPQDLNDCGGVAMENELVSDLSNMEVENDDSSTDPNVLAEENLVDMDRAENLMKVLKSADSHVTEVSSGQCLLSYYISVIEEPADSIDSGEKEHIKKLLKDYEREQGAIDDELSKSGSVGGSSGEKYEKSSFGDKYFHKFSKRISRCPEQVIRYEWNGSPLHISKTGEEVQKSSKTGCTNCGGVLVFELQLVPSLISSLKFDEMKDSGIEYGTVLMYTCKASCWTDSTTHCYEHVLVQADPDQHLFQQKINQ